jgi:hypothetical protein
MYEPGHHTDRTHKPNAHNPTNTINPMMTHTHPRIPRS